MSLNQSQAAWKSVQWKSYLAQSRKYIFAPNFLHFFGTIWINLGKRDVLQILFSNCDFHENRFCLKLGGWRGRTWIPIRSFHFRVLYISVKFGVRNLHIVLLNIASFVKICDGKAVLSWLACVKLHLYSYSKTSWCVPRIHS